MSSAQEPEAADQWREEKTAEYLMRVMAQAEQDPARAALFAALADESAAQAALILASPPAFAPGFRARLLARLTRLVGPKLMRPALAAAKVRGLSVYNGPALAAGHVMPTATEDIGARHKSGRGGGFRAAVFGVNDGLVSNASLVMGMAGAGADGGGLLLTGVAGLLAGAFSMAAGEYISMRAQREMFESQIALEREELRLYPEEEAEELALIYAARGMPIDEARAMTLKLVKNPEVALDVLAREELGLNPDDLGSGVAAAIYSFLAFAAGALIPLAPIALRVGDPALAAAAVTGVALFAVGAATSLFSGRSFLVGGARMLAIGAAAGGATFLIGRLLGVAIG